MKEIGVLVYVHSGAWSGVRRPRGLHGTPVGRFWTPVFGWPWRIIHWGFIDILYISNGIAQRCPHEPPNNSRSPPIQIVSEQPTTCDNHCSVPFPTRKKEVTSPFQHSSLMVQLQCD